MSFEPKLVGRDDCPMPDADLPPMPDDWQLPAELQILGDQLRLDARKLSAQYPAARELSLAMPDPDLSGAREIATAHRTSSRLWVGSGRWVGATRWIGTGLLASGLVVAVWSAAGRVVEWRQTPSPTARQAASGSSTGSASDSPEMGRKALPLAGPLSGPSAGPLTGPLSNPSAGRLDADSGVVVPTAVMFLQEVSGPELEGLLDLLEEDSGQSWNISI